VASWLRGYEPQIEHWTWQDPPVGETDSNDTPEDARMEFRISEAS
jgi:hypothetical protein